MGAPLTTAQPLFRLRKEVSGLGQQLPGAGLLGVPPPAPPPVGAVPPLLPGAAGIFPTTTVRVNALNHQELRTLSIWYNDDFGIVAGHTEAQRRAQFIAWMCGC